MSLRAIPDVPYKDPVLYEFLLAMKQNVESMKTTITLPPGATITWGNGNSITHNTTTGKFEFRKSGALVHTI